MTLAKATSLKLKETCLQKMKHSSSVLKDRRMPSSAPIWTPRCGRRCVWLWAALSGNRYRWHFNSLQMKRPWENRPEFVPSVVVYSIAFLVSKNFSWSLSKSNCWLAACKVKLNIYEKENDHIEIMSPGKWKEEDTKSPTEVCPKTFEYTTFCTWNQRNRVAPMSIIYPKLFKEMQETL